MGSTLVAFVVLGAASLLLHSSKAAVYEVGDSTGWKAPSDSSFYSTWASDKSFTVGDVLTFTFSTTVHDVATVSKSDYDNCNIASQSNVLTVGPATITLNATGNQYYFCTLSNHCTRGQKLAITVAASSTPSPPGTPPTTPSSSPPPPSSSTPSPPPPPSASSSLVATFALVFMSIAISFMYYF
ncbi:hypothetical protein POPTR_018G129400v4 [Populus trichocarpa]|uniref:Uncharacterized protein n=1 Tax=Populus trichocarpa TaxID=3694 RepID=A0ACC0RP26_POPTR|nr:umecyanin [Populus trichocarpa]KAI5557503.1 hypothetical protein BDE02_18G107800 [Populus trichocarpa]KAI9378667.1 hypothetical protein POPTR_018G129400v4 [Populus trichocarpa]